MCLTREVGWGANRDSDRRRGWLLAEGVPTMEHQHGHQGVPVRSGPVNQSVASSRFFGLSALPGRTELGPAGVRAAEDRRQSILVAENEAANRQLMEQILLLGGYCPLAVADGRKALDLLRAARVDLVLLDLSMPVLDGFRTAAVIRTLPGCASLPVIAVSGHAQSATRDEALRAGCTAFLTKPFHPRDLLRVVQSLLQPPDELDWR